MRRTTENSIRLALSLISRRKKWREALDGESIKLLGLSPAIDHPGLAMTKDEILEAAERVVFQRLDELGQC